MLHARTRLRLLAGLTAMAALTGVTGLAFAADRDLSVNGGARRTTGDNSATVVKAADPRTAKNVILLIGDGMGDSEITSARNYAVGAAGRFAGIDALPLTGQYTTYSLKKDGTPDYVPDSAATGSAWATGTKTYDNAVSVDIRGKAQQTILELAKQRGLKTGDVTTAEIQDATPAVLVSHISARSCYGPDQTSTTCSSEALENGGPGSITEQLLGTRPDVTLGGGSATFAQKAKAGPYYGMTLTQQARARGYQLVGDDTTVGTKAGLDAITKADQTAPVLGLFATGNMPVRYTGPAASSGGDAKPAVRCSDNTGRPATQPTLADMTSKAISLLDNPNGFFLQVEGASIDKRDHASDACGQIGEVVDLDEAVQVALAYARKQGNTSVFLTADHGHSSQIVEVVPTGGTSTTPGSTVTLTTADGAPMALSYATAPQTASQQHTGTQVRIAGYGPKAADIVGLTDQTDLFFTMKDALFGTDATVPLPTAPATPTAPRPDSNGAYVRVKPDKVGLGEQAIVFGRGFLADAKVELVAQAGGRKVVKTRKVTDGAVLLALRLGRATSYRVTLRGLTSGKVVSDTLTVTHRK